MGKINKLIIDTQFGLCNRISAYASAKSIAEKSGYDFYLIWKKDIHCGADFNDLFINKEKTIEKIPKECDMYDYTYNKELDKQEKNPIDTSTNKDIYIKSGYLLKGVVDHVPFIKKLQPVEKIQRIIDNFEIKPNTIGVHIRTWEPDKWEGNCEKMAEKTLIEYKKRRKKTECSVFIKKIKEILCENKDQQFFLCSNSEDVYKQMYSLFPENIIYYNRDTFDRSKEQLESALIDMCLLSKCNGLLGSVVSTFTEVVGFLLKSDKIEIAGKDF